MPGTLQPVGQNGITPAMWNTLIQQVNQLWAIVQGGATNNTMIVLDQYGNAVAIVGQLNQTVSNGATSGGGGTTAPTGLTGAGIASHKTGSWVQL
jgi:hypothetical protein